MWIEDSGALAMFDGPDSPITQTFGLGVNEEATAGCFDRLETFFRQRGAVVCHEVSPLAEASLFRHLHQRRYEAIEFTSVMWQPISLVDHGPVAHRIAVRPVNDDEHDLWAATAARGWSHLPGLTGFMESLARVNRERANQVSFLAFLDDIPSAAGALSFEEGVALLAGASTVPEARRQGAQQALLNARLRFAADNGCDIAMMGALPGSESQRNAERKGFRIAYTRIKWRLAETNP